MCPLEPLKLVVPAGGLIALQNALEGILFDFALWKVEFQTLYSGLLSATPAGGVLV